MEGGVPFAVPGAGTQLAAIKMVVINDDFFILRIGYADSGLELRIFT